VTAFVGVKSKVVVALVAKINVGAGALCVFATFNSAEILVLSVLAASRLIGVWIALFAGSALDLPSPLGLGRPSDPVNKTSEPFTNPLESVTSTSGLVISTSGLVISISGLVISTSGLESRVPAGGAEGTLSLTALAGRAFTSPWRLGRPSGLFTSPSGPVPSPSRFL